MPARSKAAPHPLLRLIALVPVKGLRRYLKATNGTRNQCIKRIVKELKNLSTAEQLVMVCVLLQSPFTYSNAKCQLLGTATLTKVTPTCYKLKRYIGVAEIRRLESNNRETLALTAADVCIARIKKWRKSQRRPEEE
ncbi:hypothetical protein B0H10DRAFT_1957415 [Mycena sp. CBHHK59/15]|nr:hypothetical protein B0H10DRAFT_1964433 [Mycena sp. CBHHK59/15]KAJ6604927.1 hypothetical protein B0H10DRAFT_1957415 [Mycena sp. CBHHK59/15]